MCGTEAMAAVSFRALFTFEFESHLDGHLKFGNLTVGDASALLDYFKPAHMADGFGGFADGRFDGFGEAHGRGPNQLDDFEGAIRHASHLIASGRFSARR